MCVRIPSHIIKEGNIIEGMEAHIRIQPPQQIYAYNEKHIQTVLNIANDISELQNIPETKKRLFIMLNFEFLKETTHQDRKENERRQHQFISEKSKEYGKKLIDEFITFSLTLNKKAYKTEDDVTILKPKFEHHLR